MNTPDKTTEKKELFLLLIEVLDNPAGDAAKRETLNRILLDDPQARVWARDFLHEQSQLEMILSGENDSVVRLRDAFGNTLEQLAKHQQQETRGVNLRTIVSWAIAAGLMFAVGIGAYFAGQKHAGWPGDKPTGTENRNGITVSDTNNLNSEDGLEAGTVDDLQELEEAGEELAVLAIATGEIRQAPMLTGSSSVLGLGKLVTADGFYRLEFMDGTVMLGKGELDLEIIGPQEVRCHTGAYRFQMADGESGFVVHLPDGELLDLGTEFGIELNDKRSRIEVFDGAVELRSPSGDAPERLGPGKVAAFSSDGIAYNETETLHDSVPDFSEVRSHASADMQARDKRWKETIEQLSARPSAICVYDFAGPFSWDNRIMNRATGPNKVGESATAVGGSFENGVWSGASAFEGKRRGDRVVIPFGSEVKKNLTIMTWVRIDSLAKAATVICASDGFAATDARWSFHKNGSVHFVVKGRSKTRFHLASNLRMVNRSHLGRWILLTAVLDGDRGVARLRLNDEVIATAPYDAKNILLL